MDKRDCIFPDCLVGRIGACEHSCPFEREMKLGELYEAALRRSVPDETLDKEERPWTLGTPTR